MLLPLPLPGRPHGLRVLLEEGSGPAPHPEPAPAGVPGRAAGRLRAHREQGTGAAGGTGTGLSAGWPLLGSCSPVAALHPGTGTGWGCLGGGRAVTDSDPKPASLRREPWSHDARCTLCCGRCSVIRERALPGVPEGAELGDACLDASCPEAGKGWAPELCWALGTDPAAVNVGTAALPAPPSPEVSLQKLVTQLLIIFFPHHRKRE